MKFNTNAAIHSIFVILSLLSTTKSYIKKDDLVHIQIESPEDTEYDYQLFLDDGQKSPETSIQEPPETSIQSPLEDIENETPENEGVCKVVYGKISNKANEIYKRNTKALDRIERYMYLYVLAEGLNNFSQAIDDKVSENGLELTQDEKDALESAKRVHCDMEDLKEIYNTLINIPDNYEGFNNESDTFATGYIVTQLDKVNDYVENHFEKFRKELIRLHTTKDYYERKNFYKQRKGKATMMAIFYEWLENVVCRPRKLDEAAIREKINEHLQWLVSLPVE